MKRISIALLVGVMVLGVGCRRMEERRVYKIARHAVKETFGEETRVSPIEESRLAVGKNGARVDVDYERASGTPAEGYMTVWCKRVRLRWILDRAIDRGAH